MGKSLKGVRQPGDIYLTRSSSWLSKIIQYWTRSKFSHGGIVFNGDFGVEALWSGVRLVRLPKENVIYLTPVKPFTPSELITLYDFLLEQEGKKYDFKGIFNFIIRGKNHERDKWYCFELMYEAYRAAGRLLGRLDQYYIDGHMIYFSNTIKPLEQN